MIDIKTLSLIDDPLAGDLSGQFGPAFWGGERLIMWRFLPTSARRREATVLPVSHPGRRHQGPPTLPGIQSYAPANPDNAAAG